MRAAATAALLLASLPALAREPHQFLEIALSPDGKRLASVEGDGAPGGAVPIETVVVRDTATGAATEIALPCGRVRECTPSGLAWSPDGRRLVFALRAPGSHAYSLMEVATAGGAPRALLKFNGTLGAPRFSQRGELAVLATEGAEKEQGAVEAGAPLGGELGGTVHERRIALVQADGTLRWASPDNLFVYQYDWQPAGGFVGTAAPGDGDNNWWIAKLYAFEGGAARVLHTPTTSRQQLANPTVSPDGKQIAFIGGLMSDFGATGGDVFVVPAAGGRPEKTAAGGRPEKTAAGGRPEKTAAGGRPEKIAAGGRPENITAGRHATATALSWTCDGGGLIVSELAGGTRRIVEFRGDRKGPPTPVFEGDVTLSGTDAPFAGGCTTAETAAVREDFVHAPEIVVGKPGAWRELTHANAGMTAPVVARNLSWRSGNFTVQGWLLLPVGSSAAERLPLVVDVHGGPAWASQPEFAGARHRAALLGAGYALLLPNPRGSFGQGEAFQEANVRDFGRGDLKDILAGITAAEAAAPIDDARVGLMGWSYGGFMTMFAVTQTNRFAAAVAGAGIANWQSYYGQNGIDGWMIPYFGASVYDDPAVYARASAMSFIKNVRTPVLAAVGEKDIECPAVQTQEFWHALHTLGRETTAVVYPGEGHWMHRPEHVADYQARLVSWFDRYLRGHPAAH